MRDLLVPYETLELDGWHVVKTREAARLNDSVPEAYIVWLEKVMGDGTTLRFEATLHDPRRELPMLVPILQSVSIASAPDLRLSVTRTKTTRHQIDRSQHRRSLTG